MVKSFALQMWNAGGDISPKDLQQKTDQQSVNSDGWKEMDAILFTLLFVTNISLYLCELMPASHDYILKLSSEFQNPKPHMTIKILAIQVWWYSVCCWSTRHRNTSPLTEFTHNHPDVKREISANKHGRLGRRNGDCFWTITVAYVIVQKQSNRENTIQSQLFSFIFQIPGVFVDSLFDWLRVTFNRMRSRLHSGKNTCDIRPRPSDMLNVSDFRSERFWCPSLLTHGRLQIIWGVIPIGGRGKSA